jgi:hypothetical protein
MLCFSWKRVHNHHRFREGPAEAVWWLVCRYDGSRLSHDEQTALGRVQYSLAQGSAGDAGKTWGNDGSPASVGVNLLSQQGGR